MKVLHDLMNEVKSKRYNNIHIETHHCVLTEMLEDMKGIPQDDIDIRLKKKQEMKELFTSWKSLIDERMKYEPKSNKYSSYEKITLDLDLDSDCDNGREYINY